MSRHTNYINDLFAIARDVTPVASARIAAFIVLNNSVISVGVNSVKTSPFQKRWGKNETAICIHAEISAIKNALKKIDTQSLKNTTMYIARAKKNGQKGKDVFGLAKPCLGCQRAIAAFGIKKVYHTTDVHGEYDLF